MPASVFALSVPLSLSRLGSGTLMGTDCLDLLIREKPKLVFIGQGHKGNEARFLNIGNHMEKDKEE